MKNPFQKKSSDASVPPPSGSPGSDPSAAAWDDPATSSAAGKEKTSSGAKKGSVDAEKSGVSNATKKTLLAVGAAAILAVSGVLMLVSYVRNTQETASVEDVVPEQQVLMAAGTIPAGTTLDALRSENFSRFRVERVPITLISEGTLETVEDLDNLGDVMADIDIAEGEMVRGDRFVSTTSFSTRAAAVDVPVGHHQASFRLNPERLLGGLIRPGDDVSVSASFTAAEGFPNMAVVVLRSIEVMNVQVEGLPSENEVAGGRDSVGVAPTAEYLVTVAVTADELAKLNYAMDFGRLMVASASDTPDNDMLAVENLTSIVSDAGARIDSVSGQLTIDDAPPAVAFTQNDGLTDEERDAADEANRRNNIDANQPSADDFGTDESSSGSDQ